MDCADQTQSTSFFFYVGITCYCVSPRIAHCVWLWMLLKAFLIIYLKYWVSCWTHWQPHDADNQWYSSIIKKNHEKKPKSNRITNQNYNWTAISAQINCPYLFPSGEGTLFANLNKIKYFQLSFRKEIFLDIWFWQKSKPYLAGQQISTCSV